MQENSTGINPDQREQLRALPSVDALLAISDELITQYGRESVTDALRTVLERNRQQILKGDDATTEPDALFTQTRTHLEMMFRPTLHPVINATGVIIHTNLGRAPLSEDAIQAVQEIALGYSTLEFDMADGKRGSRLIHAEKLLQEITGADAAMVVNNNAAATVLMLAGLAYGREVIVSRGQLVEIGGGFRVPEIMKQSGATLVEVGTTNRTRAADYEQAITEQTALLMRVHASNFKLVGFTESAALNELVGIAQQHNVFAVDDLGSGALIDTAQFGLEHEPTVQESIAAGCDVVAFSGDKLLGGPQAGILVGKRELIDQLKKHPLARAIRADKLGLAALSATLDHYRRGEALSKIPVLQMMALPLDEIDRLARDWAGKFGDQAQVIPGESAVGGGSLPGATLPTWLLAFDVSSPDAVLAELRQTRTPIIARILDERVVFDPRTILPTQRNLFLEMLRSIF